MAAGGLEVNGFKYREMEKRLCRPEKKERRDEAGRTAPFQLPSQAAEGGTKPRAPSRVPAL